MEDDATFSDLSNGKKGVAICCENSCDEQTRKGQNHAWYRTRVRNVFCKEPDIFKPLGVT